MVYNSLNAEFFEITCKHYVTRDRQPYPNIGIAVELQNEYFPATISLYMNSTMHLRC